jgi:hypothetical protein
VHDNLRTGTGWQQSTQKRGNRGNPLNKFGKIGKIWEIGKIRKIRLTNREHRENRARTPFKYGKIHLNADFPKVESALILLHLG